jgi:hypothetical protein
MHYHDEINNVIPYRLIFLCNGLNHTTTQLPQFLNHRAEIGPTLKRRL